MLKNIVLLPHVEWVGYSTLDQEFVVDLQQALKTKDTAPAKRPIIINLFDDDADGQSYPITELGK